MTCWRQVKPNTGKHLYIDIEHKATLVHYLEESKHLPFCATETHKGWGMLTAAKLL